MCTKNASKNSYGNPSPLRAKIYSLVMSRNEFCGAELSVSIVDFANHLLKKVLTNRLLALLRCIKIDQNT